MMRNLRRMLILVGLLAPIIPIGSVWQEAAPGDVVYMRDGRSHEGKATREGNKVRIELAYPAGTIIEVNADDVSYITTGPVATRPVSSEPETMPVIPIRDRQFSVERATRAEPVIFVYMRNLTSTPEGDSLIELRRVIDGWQVAAKDRKRQVAPQQWVTPKDFDRCRQAAQNTLKESHDLFVKAKRIYGDTPKDKDERKQTETTALAKMKQGAQSWADPVLKNFLTGAAEHAAKSYSQAEALFRLAASEAPRVPAFQQGLGMSLMELNRFTEALGVYMDVLALQPDSRDALQLARDALKKVPGTDLNHPTYINARKVLSLYQEPEITMPGSPTHRITWLMPGKSVTIYDDTLPVPLYDRLVFRQGAAVPISDTSLLVDSQVVKDALEAYVQIDSRTVAPAKLRRTTYYSASKAPVPSLEILTVPGYTFTSVAGKDAPKLAKGQAVKTFSIGVYEEMTCLIRQGKADIANVAADGTIKLSTGLLPGEGAGPVLTADGQLAGFLAARTDPFAEGGGVDKFIGLAELAPLLKQVQRSYYDSYGGYGKAKRTVTTQPAGGQCFVVYATIGEKVE